MIPLLLALSLVFQASVKNPRFIDFECPDHTLDDQHELEIVRVSDGVVIQTILLGDPPATTLGIVTAPLNIQPVAFGTYFVRIRAVVGTVKSELSDPSNTWDRVPGKPSGLMAR